MLSNRVERILIFHAAARRTFGESPYGVPCSLQLLRLTNAFVFQPHNTVIMLLDL